MKNKNQIINKNKNKEKMEKIEAISIILNLLIATFAFAFIFSLAFGVVSGEDDIASMTRPLQTFIPASGSGQGGGITATAVKNAERDLLRITGDFGDDIGEKNLLEIVQDKDLFAELEGNSQLAKEMGIDEVFTDTFNGENVKVVDFGAGKRVWLDESGEVVYQVTGEGSSKLSRFFQAGGGTSWDAILTGAQWAFIAYGAAQMIGGFLGLDEGVTNALSYGAAAGFGAGKLFATLQQGKAGGLGKFFLDNTQWMGEFAPTANPVAWGIGIGILVFVMTYKETKEKLVIFECYPWEAPTGGNDCEKCNDDMYPCSEYRCKSLGQACELLNPGTEEEKCAWVNPHDVKSPTIEVWSDVLTKGYNYKPDTAVRPPARGVEIAREGEDKCIKAFTPIQFGIFTNEPSQCKIDYNHTNNFDEMTYYFGSSNLYRYNHTQKLSLPGPDAVNSLNPVIKNDGVYSLFVRCRDANGNENVDEFSFRFCVEKGPDTTPPNMATTSLGSSSPFSYNTEKLNIDLYVNEPVTCKWSRDDKSYDSMENDMSCGENIWDMNPDLVYTCRSELTGLKNRIQNKFYFRCKDQPWKEENERNTNQESFVLTLQGTQPLDIIKLSPQNETVKGYGKVIPVNIEVETKNGYNDEAFCYYSPTENEENYIMFYETNARKHSQRLDLVSGSYEYYIKCVDLGGNTVYNTTRFSVESDNFAPEITRAYKEADQLKIITDEESTCSYSLTTCNFALDEGIEMPYPESKEHTAEWDINRDYHIKCSDKYDNQPDPSQCNIIVRGFQVS